MTWLNKASKSDWLVPAGTQDKGSQVLGMIWNTKRYVLEQSQNIFFLLTNSSKLFNVILEFQ